MAILLISSILGVVNFLPPISPKKQHIIDNKNDRQIKLIDLPKVQKNEY